MDFLAAVQGYLATKKFLSVTQIKGTLPPSRKCNMDQMLANLIHRSRTSSTDGETKNKHKTAFGKSYNEITWGTCTYCEQKNKEIHFKEKGSENQN
jgi:hypothetical protein